MAYASLLSLTQTLEQILQSQSRDQSLLFLHEEQLQLRSLHQKLSDLLLYLENSSPKNSETTSSLEGRIRDAAYEVEDLVESHIARKSFCFQGIASCFCEIITVLQHCARCLWSTTTMSQTVEQSLQNAVEKLSSILEEVEKMKANNNGDDPLESNATVEMGGVEEAVKVHPRISLGASSSEPTFSDKSSMVGFKNDMHQIKDILTSSSTKLEIISIVGMGGIGKTTLARNVYNDSLVIRHFDIRAWITVSQEYNMTTLLAGLLRSTGEATLKIKGMDEQELKLKLYQSLKKRRYLIVLDDVWDVELLEKFERILPDDDHGSRIIITSRSSNVAGSDNSYSHTHHLNFLNANQSWNLLCQKAFGEERCPLELEYIGKRIAENCKGLALALVAVGGVLHKAKKTQAHWMYVEGNMKSAQTGNYDNLMEILSWSYKQLPQHLKACFLYMGVFHEDFIIHASHLIMLWVANGFIKPVLYKTLDEVAKEYLKDLIDRNLIMARERDYSCGEIKTCVMHDLMRNMCIKKAHEEKFLLVANNVRETCPVALKRYRHLSITNGIIRLSDLGGVYNSTLRSIRCFHHDVLKLMSFQRLKIFDGCQVTLKRFPIELEQLVNLRFIALLCEAIDKIPASLCKLRFLQTLFIFTNSYEIVIIPLEILKMPQLMHLWVERGVLHYSSGGRIENIQTIRGVTKFKFTKEALAIFPNLKTLQVSFHSTELASRSCLDNLVRLCQLEYLKLRNYPFRAFGSEPHIDLAFPVKLRKLSLRHFEFSQRQMSIIGKLPNLEVLKLKLFAFLDGWETNEGEFGELKFLFIYSPYKFSWNLEGIHFPSLECLTLQSFKICLPYEIGEIPNLKVINLYDCSSSIVDSANKIRDDQEEWGNDALMINVYPRNQGEGGFRKYMLYGSRFTDVGDN